MANTEHDRNPPQAPQLRPSWGGSDRRIPRVLVQPVQRFLRTEIAGGIVLLVAAVAALIWANSPASASYEALWTTEIRLALGSFELAEDLRHWVNDLLMALFFFVAGMEIKRELVLGELREPRAAALPLLCALGGMVVPALLYISLNAGGPTSSGWGIPMATDIAFAVGVLALVGRRAPASLKIFLLTLAIVDDLGAIAVIAVFYSDSLQAQWLLLAAVTIGAIVVCQRLRVRSLVPYVVAAGVLWLAIFESGVHATIAGVALGLLTPTRPFQQPETVAALTRRHLDAATRDPDGVADEIEQVHLLQAQSLVGEGVSPLERLEAKLHDWSSYVVLPIFALANAGVALSGSAMTAALTDTVALGVALGLIVGKPVGIVTAALIAVRLRIARLPAGVGWLELAGTGLLAGIGFTVAIFVTGLAFTDPAHEAAGKVGILFASLVAGLLGYLFLWWRDDSRSRAGAAPGD